MCRSLVWCTWSSQSTSFVANRAMVQFDSRIFRSILNDWTETYRLHSAGIFDQCEDAYTYPQDVSLQEERTRTNAIVFLPWCAGVAPHQLTPWDRFLLAFQSEGADFLQQVFHLRKSTMINSISLLEATKLDSMLRKTVVNLGSPAFRQRQS